MTSFFFSSHTCMSETSFFSLPNSTFVLYNAHTRTCLALTLYPKRKWVVALETERRREKGGRGKKRRGIIS